ncbi:MAG: dTDP-4-dehydrorhamnose reductase [Lysobacterales bacterium]
MILLLGASGQVGRELARALAPVASLTPATRSGSTTSGTPCARVDLADADGLERQLDALAPRIIVNAAAYTAVDRAEDEPELADAINHRAVAILADWASCREALLVHYSTDYVFAGDATTPYDELAQAAPLSVYGCTKWAGEEAIRSSGCVHWILRTAWVYAAHGHNFLRSMLRAAHAGKSLRVVADQFGAPTSARYIASATARLLADFVHDDSTRPRATLHVACSGEVSWHGYATRLLDRAKTLGLLASAPHVEAIESAAWPTRAPRPRYSVLNCQQLADRLGTPPAHWHDELDATLLELVDGCDLFKP